MTQVSRPRVWKSFNYFSEVRGRSFYNYKNHMFSMCRVFLRKQREAGGYIHPQNATDGYEPKTTVSPRP